jgi:hypothetical protein
VLSVCAALLTGAGIQIARAAALDLDELTRATLAPSDVPALLGPVDAFGRTGWKCVPEQAAKAQNVRDAELPQDPG